MTKCIEWLLCVSSRDDTLFKESDKLADLESSSQRVGGHGIVLQLQMPITAVMRKTSHHGTKDIQARGSSPKKNLNHTLTSRFAVAECTGMSPSLPSHRTIEAIFVRPQPGVGSISSLYSHFPKSHVFTKLPNPSQIQNPTHHQPIINTTTPLIITHHHQNQPSSISHRYPQSTPIKNGNNHHQPGRRHQRHRARPQSHGHDHHQARQRRPRTHRYHLADGLRAHVGEHGGVCEGCREDGGAAGLRSGVWGGGGGVSLALSGEESGEVVGVC